MKLNAHAVVSWLNSFGEAIENAQNLLDGLDSGAGDGDHGATMVLGTRRVMASLGNDSYMTPGEVFRTAGRSFAGVGGSIGPLWGMAMLRAAQAIGDEQFVGGSGLVLVLEASALAVQEIGGASLGDCTLLDAALPAANAFASAWRRSRDARAAASAGWIAAMNGAEATRKLEPRRGRAARNPILARDRVDPGAASVALAWTVAARPRSIPDWYRRMAPREGNDAIT